MAKARRAKVQAANVHRGRLISPEALIAERCRAYYRVLNDQPGFQVALRELRDFVQPYCPLMPMRRVTAEAVLPKMHEFASRWGLPTRPGRWRNGQASGRSYGVHDLIWSLDLGLPDAEEPDGVPRLVVGSRSSTIGQLVEWSLPQDEQDPTSERSMLLPSIRPAQPEAFVYDPTALRATAGAMTPRELKNRARAIAAAVEQDILAQAAAIDDRAEALGWGRLSIRYRKPDEVLRGAVRLYRRAVLHDEFEDIAIDEALLDPRAPGGDSIKKTVREWAEALGVVLPEDRKVVI